MRGVREGQFTTMAQSSLARLAGTLHAPAEARRFATAFLADHASGPARISAAQVNAVATVVSELVTNSVRAGAQTILVQLVLGRARLRIEVTDDVAGWPRLRTPRPDDPTGRGLTLVAALADGWGVSPIPGPGKLVWATVAL